VAFDSGRAKEKLEKNGDGAYSSDMNSKQRFTVSDGKIVLTLVPAEEGGHVAPRPVTDYGGGNG
jgi:hypothetical protein